MSSTKTKPGSQGSAGTQGLRGTSPKKADSGQRQTSRGAVRPDAKAGKALKTKQKEASETGLGGDSDDTKLAWTFITSENIDELGNLDFEEMHRWRHPLRRSWRKVRESPRTVQSINLKCLHLLTSKLATILSIHNWKDDLQANCLLAFHMSNFMWAKDNGFNARQISTFFSIMKFLLDKTISDGLTATKAMELFQTYICYETMPMSSSIGGGGGYENESQSFTLKEAISITDFVTTTFMQHFRLVQCVFVTDQDKLDVETQVSVEKPMCPRPLAEGMTLLAWEAEEALKREAERREREELERRLAEERAKNFNPFEVLTNEEIKHITTEVIQNALGSIYHEIDTVVETHKQRQLASLAGYIKEAP
ncbi:flagellar C1a complex subunit C1a-32-domain-containing protein [Polychytrium aggregatum]|uniref:flagellar C1a complex subunit C1a-32-domain-containing protein n=1 Tax=Polychytrium aggregatum TaxID=110093 RepID=UPI0022FF2436|nr:flagellar C1a complex subunit C1a-32-domain-containing protein [Polychytrium aggregatum]KAI9205798.1 flagellar C1a complex subunit C1a-32-domain-containing protein [Polychytrium aggregatum]